MVADGETQDMQKVPGHAQRGDLEKIGRALEAAEPDRAQTVRGRGGTAQGVPHEAVPELQVQAAQEDAQERRIGHHQGHVRGREPVQAAQERQQEVRRHRGRGRSTRVHAHFRHGARGREHRRQGQRGVLVDVFASLPVAVRRVFDVVVVLGFVVVRHRFGLEIFRPPQRHHTGEPTEPGEHGPTQIPLHHRLDQGRRRCRGDKGRRHCRRGRAHDARVRSRQGADQPDVRLAQLAGERDFLRRVVRVLRRQAAEIQTAELAELVGHDHGTAARRRSLPRARRPPDGRRRRRRLRRPRRRHVAQPRVGRVAHVRPPDGPAAGPAFLVHRRPDRAQPHERRPSAGQGRAALVRRVPVVLRETRAHGLLRVVRDGRARRPRRCRPVDPAGRHRPLGQPDRDRPVEDDGHRIAVHRSGQREHSAELAPRVLVPVRHDRHTVQHGRGRRLGRRRSAQPVQQQLSEASRQQQPHREEKFLRGHCSRRFRWKHLLQRRPTSCRPSPASSPYIYTHTHKHIHTHKHYEKAGTL